MPPHGDGKSGNNSNRSNSGNGGNPSPHLAHATVAGRDQQPPTPGMPVAQALKLDLTALPAQVFAVYCPDGAADEDLKREKARNSFGAKGRDPMTIQSVLAPMMMRDPVWRRGIAVAQLQSNWEQIVGDGIAQHCRPVSYVNGVLTVEPSSTVWAQQLAFLAPQMCEALKARVPGLDITSVKVTAPRRPTFRRGKWDTKKGRGVRDTYF